MTEFLLTPLLLIVAFGIAIGTIPGLIALTRLILSKEGYLPYYFFGLMFVDSMRIAVSGRNLFMMPSEVGIETVTTPTATIPLYLILLGRANSAFIVFAACKRIIDCILNPQNHSYKTIPLISALLLFFLTNILFPALFSTHPSFTHEYFYLTLIGLAALFPKEKTLLPSVLRAIACYFY